MKDRSSKIGTTTDLREIYGKLYHTSKMSEFDNEFEKNPAVIFNIGNDNIQDESLWHLIDPEKSGPLGFRLYLGAVLRFGKQRAEVKMISTTGTKKGRSGNTRQTHDDLMDMDYNNYYSDNEHAFQANDVNGGAQIDPDQVINIRGSLTKRDEDGEEKKCWICLEGESSERPFAMNICKCSKNMTKHVDCLIEWVSKKCERSKMGFITFYDFSRMVCEICKDQFPSIIEYKDKKKMFIDFDPTKINHPFMVLNIYKIDNNILKGVAVVEFRKSDNENQRANKNPKVITFGRNEKNDINFKGTVMYLYFLGVFLFD